ncbi:7835_t:CDS:2, partial [Entrophospora sp. SA101]
MDIDDDTEEEISENILVAEESHSDEFLYIRISGDGRNVGRKIKQVMITFALLNDHENIFSPSNHYSLALYTGQEDYECLKNVLSPLIQELKDLKQNGFVDNFDKCWKVSLYISSDWKFLATILGFNAANSNYFCPWCNCNKSQQGKLNLNWSISKKMEELSVNYDPKNPKLHNGQIRQPLFSMIPLDHWVIDELHLMLRVIDHLLSLLFNEIKFTQSSNKNYSETLRKTVQEEMERIKVSFKFSLAENSKQWTYTSLMELWDGFAALYNNMCNSNYNPLLFQNDASLWIKKFLTKSQ